MRTKLKINPRTGLPEQIIVPSNGNDGDPGFSAYELAVINGFIGTKDEWLASLKGDKGEQGPKGDKGDKGDQGEKGDSGEDYKPRESMNAFEIAMLKLLSPMTELIGEITGPQGDKGPQGERGIQGLTGPVGPKGDKGDKGDQGLKGPKGPKGDPGVRGIPGLIGQKGDNGIDGDNGESAYEIAVREGFKGTEKEWLKSLKGEQGERGYRGIRGKEGPPGEPGLVDTTVLDVTIVNHTDSVVLTLGDLRKLHIIDTTAGDKTVTLPSVSANEIGIWVSIGRKGANRLSIIRADADEVILSTAYKVDNKETRYLSTISLELQESTYWGIGRRNFGVWRVR